jgi:hypothetical protein
VRPDAEVRATDVLRKHDCEMAIGNRLELATLIDRRLPRRGDPQILRPNGYGATKRLRANA